MEAAFHEITLLHSKIRRYWAFIRKVALSWPGFARPWHREEEAAILLWREQSSGFPADSGVMLQLFERSAGEVAFELVERFEADKSQCDVA